MRIPAVSADVWHRASPAPEANVLICEMGIVYHPPWSGEGFMHIMVRYSTLGILSSCLIPGEASKQAVLSLVRAA